MSYPINYPTPQNANVQIFSATNQNSITTSTWVKPQGASFVWFTLIGPGGYGDFTTGGGSGAVTNFMCPAFLIPDSLVVSIPLHGNYSRPTSVSYQQKDGTGYTLLTADYATTVGGVAMTANYFTAMGIFQSVAGQDGSTLDVTTSNTTFLSGGGSSGGSQTSNYGYSAGPTGTNRNGFFQMQPIIVGAGGMNTGKGGVGCGGGVNGVGGPGLVVIITW